MVRGEWWGGEVMSYCKSPLTTHHSPLTRRLVLGGHGLALDELRNRLVGR
jgi:hypothetical protein